MAEVGWIAEGTRNCTLTSIAGRLRWRGLQRHAIEAELERINLASCRPPLPANEVRAIAKSVCRYPAGQNTEGLSAEAHDDGRQKVLRLGEIALIHRWAGPGGASERAVLFALLRIGYQTGRVQIRASERRLALAAGISQRNTVRRALGRLISTGWLALARKAKVPNEAHLPLRGATYRLLLPPAAIRQTCANRTRVVGPEVLLGQVCRIRAEGEIDAFRHGSTGGLGESAGRVYAVLGAGPTRVVDLQRLAGIASRRTVERALDRLLSAGLADQRGRSGWFKTGITVEAVAPRLRSYGKSADQREQYAREREAFERLRLLKAHYKAAALAQRRAREASRPVLVRSAAPVCGPRPHYEAQRKALLREQAVRLIAAGY